MRIIGWEVEEEGEGKKWRGVKSQLEGGEETRSWAEVDPKAVRRVRLVWRGGGPRKEPPRGLPKALRDVLEAGGRVVEIDARTGEVWVDGRRAEFRCHPNARDLGIVKILRRDEGLLQFSECAARVEVGRRDSGVALNPTSILVAQSIGTQVRLPDGRLERRYIRMFAETGEIEFRAEVV
ncbi:MAG: hypothetical protein QXJ15_04435 [Candidatus Bathyarchaeia archaeon]